jgi:hypothetical protein
MAPFPRLPAVRALAPGAAKPAVAVGATAAALGLAVLAAGLGGKWVLNERHYGSLHWHPRSVPRSAAPLVPSAAPTDAPAGQGSSGVGFHIDPRWIIGVIILALAGALGVLLMRAWARYRRTAITADSVAARGSMAIADADALPDLPPLLRGVALAQAALVEVVEPNDAIIAAWLAVESAAEQSGVARDRAQTPTEFTVAVLRRTSADPDAIAGLLRLYHLARFSSRSAGPAELSEATVLLGALADSWSAVDSAGPGGRS